MQIKILLSFSFFFFFLSFSLDSVRIMQLLDFILNATTTTMTKETKWERDAENEVTNASQIKYWNKVFLKAKDDELWNVEMKIALDKNKSNRNL